MKDLIRIPTPTPQAVLSIDMSDGVRRDEYFLSRKVKVKDKAVEDIYLLLLTDAEFTQSKNVKFIKYVRTDSSEVTFPLDRGFKLEKRNA